jgi:integrative and conjugative element protein (TIGR02256 family)
MIFSGRSGELVIKHEALSDLYSFEQKSGADESGGILLGQVYPNHVIVERITTPSILDRFGQFFFIRSRIAAQKVINKIWKRSDGEIIYLGEWHTHQETNPRPSDVDLKMIRDAVNNTIMEIDFLFLIIIGQNRTIWVGIQSRDTIEEFKKIA